eukprot:jgi/Botrbrau1/20324/Bobra.0006s0007.2
MSAVRDMATEDSAHEFRHRHPFDNTMGEQGCKIEGGDSGGLEPASSYSESRRRRSLHLGRAQKSVMVLKNISSMEYEGLREPAALNVKEGRISLDDKPPTPQVARGESAASTPSFKFRRATSRKVDEYRPHRWNVRGVRRLLLEDWAFISLGLSMPQLLAFVLSVYLGFIFIFALAFYCVGVEELAGYDPVSNLMDFEIAFWYSAINIITTGFGTWIPTSRAGYALASAEHFCGLLLSALLLSIIVTKASTTRAMLIFSNVATINQCNGVVTLTCRVGNARGNFLYSPDIRMCYVRPIRSSEGNFFWEEEPLATHDAVSLKPVYYITHAITRESPLYNKTEEDLANERGFIAIVVSATDDQTFQTLYARTVYRGPSLRWNRRFEEVLVERISPGGRVKSLTIDFDRFHDTVRMDAEHKIKNTAELDPPEDDLLAGSHRSEEISIVESQMAELMQKLEELRTEVNRTPKGQSRAANMDTLLTKASGMLAGAGTTAMSRAGSVRLPTKGLPPGAGDYGSKRRPWGFARMSSLTPSGPGDPVPFLSPAPESWNPPPLSPIQSVQKEDFLRWNKAQEEQASPFASASQTAFPSDVGPRRLMRSRVSFNNAPRHCSPVRETSREQPSGEMDGKSNGTMESHASGSDSVTDAGTGWDPNEMPISPFQSLTSQEPFE